MPASIQSEQSFRCRDDLLNRRLPESWLGLDIYERLNGGRESARGHG